MSDPILTRIRGSLLAGAVGDALGAPIEFDSRDAIRRKFGSGGLTGYARAYGRLGAITDDTQMSLFVAEGLILAARAGALDRPSERLRHLHRAHLRWLRTQGEPSRHPTFERTREGWLLNVEALYSRRAPGRTCLSALRSDRMGRLEHPLNDSKGCGGVMRVAPVGLARRVDAPFRTGCEVAALTHGHPSGYLAAGYLAFVLRGLVVGTALEEACEESLEELRRWPGHEECALAVETAIAAARTDPPGPDTVEALGAGWLAEEALSISLYCALSAPDLESGLLLAVNHGGDSDSTGAITGNLMGAIHSDEAIPARWLDSLELREQIGGAAEELLRSCGPES